MRAGARQAALLSGAKKYFTGLPCKRGHIAERRTGCGRCVMCEAAQPAYQDRANHLRMSREWKARNPERSRESSCRWVLNNPEARRASNRRGRAKWAAEPENKPKINAWATARRAAKACRTPPWADLEAIKEIYARCPIGFHVDHIVPLKGKTVSGLHVPWNLQYLPPIENLRKNNSWPPRS